MTWVVKMLAPILIVVSGTALWHKVGPRSFLPWNKWLQVEDDYEPTGRDGLYCMKVKLEEDQVRLAISRKHLVGMATYPEHDAYPANCSSAWWDIDFPMEAQMFKVSGDGGTRELAAYRHGFFYYVSEAR